MREPDWIRLLPDQVEQTIAGLLKIGITHISGGTLAMNLAARVRASIEPFSDQQMQDLAQELGHTWDGTYLVVRICDGAETEMG